MQVELDVPLDADPAVYDSVRGEELAQLHLGDSPSEEAIRGCAYPTGRMDKLTLSSSLAPLDAHYCLAVIDERGLHVTPATCVVQLRPSMAHLDAEQDGAESIGDGEGEGEGGDDEAGGTALTVTVQTTRERRLAALKAARAEPDEPWTHLDVLPAQRGYPEHVCSLLTGAGSQGNAPFDLSRQQYIHAIGAASARQTVPGGAGQQMYARATLPLYKMADRVRSVMCNGVWLGGLQPKRA